MSATSTGATNLWDWIDERIGLPGDALAPLRALAGRKLGELVFLETVEEVRDLIRPTTPVHVLPVATDDFLVLGLHLRPEDVESGGVRLMAWGWEYRDRLTDLGTPSQAVLAKLCRMEQAALESGDEGLGEALLEGANAAFGVETFSREEIHRALQRKPGEAGAAPSWTGALVEEIRFELGLSLEAFADKLEVFDAARAVLPELMCLHAGAARCAMFGFDFPRAARAMVEALGCWHHTACGDARPVFSLAELLLEQAPEVFDEKTRREIEIFDDAEATAEETRRLAKEKNAAAIVKLLNDRGHFHQDYSPGFENLRSLYRHLGWEWALALLDLR